MEDAIKAFVMYLQVERNASPETIPPIATVPRKPPVLLATGAATTMIRSSTETSRASCSMRIVPGAPSPTVAMRSPSPR